MYPKSYLILAKMVQSWLFVCITASRLFGKINSLGVLPENITETDRIQAYFANLHGDTYPNHCSGVSRPDIRNGMIPENYRWKDFKVYVHRDFSRMDRKLINNALFRLSQYLPCVSFKLMPKGSTLKGDAISVVKQDGCWSSLGRQGGIQSLSLGDGCVHMSVIIHEFMHALGVDHEQSRIDRDDYINILTRNIQPQNLDQFEKVDPRFFSTYDVAYNTKSIMHYESYIFSKNGQPTMLTKDGKVIKRNLEVQDTDIQKLQRMYNCQLK